MRAENARVELGASAPQAALKVLSAGREIDGRDSADLDFALLETHLALSTAASFRHGRSIAIIRCGHVGR